MKRTKDLRTLEELWDLEDKHPLNGANPAGLLRWMYATGILPKSRRQTRKDTQRTTLAFHKEKEGQHGLRGLRPHARRTRPKNQSA